MAQITSRGENLAHRLRAALRDIRGHASGRCSPTPICGVSHDGKLCEDLTMEAYLDQAGQILIDSHRVYRFGSGVYLERGCGDKRWLSPLALGTKLEPGASGLLSSVVVAAQNTANGTVQSLLPGGLLAAVLNDGHVLAALPEVREYARRPVFGPEYQLLGPGWHPEPQVLVHGPEVQIIESPLPPPDAQLKPLQRMPARVRALLGGFCWATDADLVNALALLLTGLLVNRFIEDSHPAGFIDGNQPGVGKTLFIDVLGLLLDGAPPPRIPLNRDEELEKRLGAHVREPNRSIIFLDNIRQRVESTVLEENILAPLVSFRLLGHSRLVEQPNTYMWFLTANGTRLTADMLSRGLPVRLHYSGDPRKRQFSLDPLPYAREHRLAILGELAGLVRAWVSAGRPPGQYQHRCQRWAEVVGGILDVAGLGEHFLANLTEVEATMDEGLTALLDLAEVVMAGGDEALVAQDGVNTQSKGKPPKGWVPHLRQAGVLTQQSGDREQAECTRAGNFLSAKTNREVTIEVDSQVMKATLRCRPGRSNQKFYYFDLKPSPTTKGTGEEQGPPPEAAVGMATEEVVGAPADQGNTLSWD
jgi:hypothetical protein